jgi:hypothetical protein
VLNTRLRREGVVMDLEELYVCAESINPDELVQVLAANFTVERVVPLIRIGLVNAQDIISHRDDLPTDFVNQILGIKF